MKVLAKSIISLYWLSVTFIHYSGNFIDIFDVTATPWTSASEVYHFLQKDEDACTNLLKAAERIRRPKHSTVFARHHLLFLPIPLYKDMTPQELKTEIARQTTLHLYMYSI